MKKRVTVTALYDLTQELEGREVLKVSMGNDRDVLAISSALPLARNNGFVIRDGKEFRFAIHHRTIQGVREITLAPCPRVFPFVQAFEDGYLCVDSLRRLGEDNAFVFNDSGALVHSWHAGDAVEDVQVSPDGKVWVSYFDEGIFGGNPLSQQGLNCFNADGARTFGFVDSWNKERGRCGMASAYALNVATNEDTWFSYHCDFQLIHIVDERIIDVFEPSPEMIGMDASAVRSSCLLFTGGFKNKKRVFWRDLTTQQQLELEVVTEDGNLLEWSSAVGHGVDLFFCKGPQVWVLSFDALDL